MLTDAAAKRVESVISGRRALAQNYVGGTGGTDELEVRAREVRRVDERL